MLSKMMNNLEETPGVTKVHRMGINCNSGLQLRCGSVMQKGGVEVRWVLPHPTCQVKLRGVDATNISLISTWVNCCQTLLLQIGMHQLCDWSTTLLEHLSAHDDIFNRPYMTMAKMWSPYLNLQQVKALLASPSPIMLGTPFLNPFLYTRDTRQKRYSRGTQTSLVRSYCRSIMTTDPLYYF